VLQQLRKPSIPSARWANAGEQIQAVISVGIVSVKAGTPSRDAHHGLRAFTSQLLCEQVVAAVSVALPMR